METPSDPSAMVEMYVKHGVLSQDSAEQLGSKPTLFSGLSIDAFENVIRRMSLYPSDEHWRNYLLPDELGFLLGPKGPVPMRVRACLMPTVVLSPRNTIYLRGTNVFNGKVQMPSDAIVVCVFECPLIGTLFAIAGHAAENIHTMVIDQIGGDALLPAAVQSYHHVCTAVAERGEKLRCMEVTFMADDPLAFEAFDKIARKRGEQIRKLTLNFISCTPDYVAEAYAIVDYINDIETFSVTMKSSPGLQHVATLCGNSLNSDGLVELSIVDDKHPTPGLVSRLSNNCVALERVCIDCTDDLWDHAPYCEMLCRAGSRLKHVNLGNMNAALCARVRTSCPNARFTLRCNGELAPRLRALGTSLVGLEARLVPHEADEVMYAASECASLETLDLNLGDEDWSPQDSTHVHNMAASLFARSMIALRRISVKGYRGVTDVGGVFLTSIARNATKLEYLYLAGRFPDFKRLEAFSGASLLDVTIHSHGGQTLSQVVCGVTKPFVQCGDLQNLRMISDLNFRDLQAQEYTQDMQKIAENMFRVRRGRRIQVHITKCLLVD